MEPCNPPKRKLRYFFELGKTNLKYYQTDPEQEKCHGKIHDKLENISQVHQQRRF